MRIFTLGIATCLLIAGIATAVYPPARAAQTPASAHLPKNGAELLVFEAKGCTYCFIFRRDVVPNYMRSPRAKDVPMRFIDVHTTDPKQLQLRAPLSVLPTVVFMQNGQEVERITGYMGPEPFFYMVSRLIK